MTDNRRSVLFALKNTSATMASHIAVMSVAVVVSAITVQILDITTARHLKAGHLKRCVGENGFDNHDESC